MNHPLLTLIAARLGYVPAWELAEARVEATQATRKARRMHAAWDAIQGEYASLRALVDAFEGVLVALRGLRESPADAPLPPHVLRQVADAMKASAKPRDLVVLVLDRGALANKTPAQRWKDAQRLTRGLARDVFPEFRFAVESGDGSRVVSSEVN